MMPARELPGIGLLAAAGASALALRMVAIVLTFAASALFARLFAPAELGLFFVTASIASFLALVAQLGLSNIAVRDIGRAMAQGRADLAAALSRKLLALVMAAGTTLIAAGALAALLPLTWFPAAFASAALPTTALAAALAIQTLVGDLFRGRRRTIAAVFYGGFLPAVGTICLAGGAILLSRTATLTAADALLMTATASLCSSGIGAWLALAAPATPTAAPAPKMAELVRSGRAFWLNGMASFFFFQADLWIAGILLPLDQTALYGAASRLVLALTLPIDAAELVLPPLISGAYATGRLPALQRVLQQAALIQTVAVGFGVAIFVGFGAPLLTLAFGTGYGAGSAVLAFLSLGWLARASMGACGYTLSMTCHADLMMLLTVGLGLAFVPLYWLSGNAFGASGIAVATATAMVTLNSVTAILVHKKLGIRITAFAYRG